MYRYFRRLQWKKEFVKIEEIADRQDLSGQSNKVPFLRFVFLPVAVLP